MSAPELRRSITLLPLSLYGIGTTVGAGIYVLIGAAAGYAGENIALGFLLSALIVAPSAASFAALARRNPVSAGEAAYVEEGFGSGGLSLVVGLAVVTAGMVSSAAITRGAAGYVLAIVPLTETVIIVAIVLGLGAIAAWGISQSMILAASLAVIEILGLVAVIAVGFSHLSVATVMSALVPDVSQGFLLPATGIFQAALIAFFAFIGFEDIVNLAEETRRPRRTVPLAIAITLIATAMLYISVSLAAIAVVPPADLAQSDAPLALVIERGLGAGATAFAAIAVLAALNGILVQMVMATRVLYGLARLGRVPAFFARVNARTQTPLIATVVVVTMICTLSFALPLVRLAETTSTITLLIFTMVNLSLLAIRLRENAGVFARSRAACLPALGAITSIGFLGVQFLSASY
ncbi:Uncharacterized amino acid permease, GabP family [hydrothermal vent metagenome]|uniref:Uncharacterized amino acid permease, GabP family n=1 Tax=hydrothermal vent metagenome TaxID=652676 RepID=A0A3B0T8K2_9ZZZZ